MAKKIKLELTEAQFEAVIQVKDEMDSGIGGGEDEDIQRIRWVMLINRMLKNNGYNR